MGFSRVTCLHLAPRLSLLPLRAMSCAQRPTQTLFPASFLTPFCCQLPLNRRWGRYQTRQAHGAEPRNSAWLVQGSSHAKEFVTPRRAADAFWRGSRVCNERRVT